MSSYVDCFGCGRPIPLAQGEFEMLCHSCHTLWVRAGMPDNDFPQVTPHQPVSMPKNGRALPRPSTRPDLRKPYIRKAAS
jgi:hypothetical protein